MNKVFLIGRLTRDPELRYTSNNTAVASFTLAVNRTYTNQAGEREADFINVVVWRRQAETVKNYLSQGSQLAVEGRIQVRSYDDQNGQRRYVTEVVADNVEFIGSRKDNNNNSTPTTATTSIPKSSEPTPYDFKEEPTTNMGTDISDNPYADFGSSIEISDDELPF
ncbi:MAG TPA: single-stranded DNA-binding protein [Candidatus Onthousia faecavium]|nr:single-stranded DNA-binding protein [Candidatus Onthousia faecavium]